MWRVTSYERSEKTLYCSFLCLSKLRPFGESPRNPRAFYCPQYGIEKCRWEQALSKSWRNDSRRCCRWNRPPNFNGICREMRSSIPVRVRVGTNIIDNRNEVLIRLFWPVGIFGRWLVVHIFPRNNNNKNDGLLKYYLIYIKMKQNKKTQ